MSADYFAVATAIARSHEADRKAQVCRCDAYAFPHRPGSGRCPAPEIGITRYSTDPRPLWEAEERRLFDAAEARAINSGAW